MHLCKLYISLIPPLLLLSFQLLLLPTAFGEPQQTETDTSDANVERCVSDALRVRPELKDRFDVGLLKVACRKHLQWNKMAVNGVEKSNQNPLLTPSQTAWADRLFQCFDQKCMCQMFDQCKNDLRRIAATPVHMHNTSTFQVRTIDKRSVDQYLRETPGFEHLVRMATPRQKRAVISQVEKLLTQRIGKATRKEIRRLTDDERQRFFAALQTLKTEKIDTMSKYDIMIIQHTAEYSPGAHFSAAFLPFHREFAKTLEMALRTVDPTTALPYWDPTMDQGLPDPRDSIMWNEEFMGNGWGDVVVGPFANWTTVSDSQFHDLSPNKKIVRNLGVSQYGSLYRDKDIEEIMTRKKFRDLVYCVDPFFELVHGANHLWMGGHMNELRISPNDPIFFLFHSFVDYIWEQWRQKNQDYSARSRDYSSAADSCNQFARPDARMRPYTIRNEEGLSNQYTEVLYDYEPRPTCSSSKPDCGSPYLFCHTGKSKCLSKVKIGGNCGGLESYHACWNGECDRGQCVEKSQDTTTTTSTSTTSSPTTTEGPTPPSSKRTTTSAPSSTQNTVWVPVTILALNGRSGGGLPSAKIVTTDKDSGEQWIGSVGDPSEKPYYTGSSFAQVRSPFASDQRGPVNVQVEAFDDNGRKCASMCQEQGSVYSPCEITFTLTATSQQADGLDFAQSIALAKLLNWQGEKHVPDRFLIMCPTGKSRASPGVSPRESAPPTTTAATVDPTSTPSISVSMNGQETSSSSNGDDIMIKVVHSNGGTSTKATPTTTVSIGAPPGGGPPSGAAGRSDSDDCMNDHRCCPIWAAAGECSRNSWMKNACRRVCNVCKSDKSASVSGSCTDLHPKCQDWADEGQCETNDLWMEENCKRTCEVCDRSLTELRSMCGAAPNKGGCIDRDPNCIDWAKQWECVNNPWWMKENCPAACNYCSPKLAF